MTEHHFYLITHTRQPVCVEADDYAEAELRLIAGTVPDESFGDSEVVKQEIRHIREEPG